MTAFTAAGTTRTTRSKFLMTVEGPPELSRTRRRAAARAPCLWATRFTARATGAAVLGGAAEPASAAVCRGAAAGRVRWRLPRARARCPFDAREGAPRPTTLAVGEAGDAAAEAAGEVGVPDARSRTFPCFDGPFDAAADRAWAGLGALARPPLRSMRGELAGAWCRSGPCGVCEASAEGSFFPLALVPVRSTAAARQKQATKVRKRVCHEAGGPPMRVKSPWWESR